METFPGAPANSDTDPCCCGTPCCLYPWPDPDGHEGGPYYPYTDLPDELMYQGMPVTVSGFDYSYFGTGFPPSSGGSTTRQVVADSSITVGWVIRDGLGTLVDTLGACLIVGSPLTEDEFSDVYSLSSGPTLLTRNSSISPVNRWPDGVEISFNTNKCTWAGPRDGNNSFWILWYGDSQFIPVGGVSDPYKFNLVFFRHDFETGYWIGNSATKDPDQTSPAGTYLSVDGLVTVS